MLIIPVNSEDAVGKSRADTHAWNRRSESIISVGCASSPRDREGNGRMKHRFPARSARTAIHLFLVGLSACLRVTPASAQTKARIVFSGNGDITPLVEQFRDTLGGPDNGVLLA